MKNKLLLLLLLLGSTCHLLRAGSLPEVSTGEKVTWYYLVFNTGTVVGCNGEGEIPTVAIPTGKADQLWKVEGNASLGYTFTSKTGQTLYVNPATYSTNFRTAAAPTSGTRFNLTAYGNGHEIIPKTGTSYSLNPWGGISLGAPLALYYKNDPNAVMQFVKEEDMASAQAQVKLIPYPQSVVMGEGEVAMGHFTTLVYPSEELRDLAETFANHPAASTQPLLAIEQGAPKADAAINLILDNTQADEGYELKVTANTIDIKANGRAGFFYALQSLRQLLPVAVYGTVREGWAEWTVPCLTIKDRPAFGHRGFMLDVSRHFFTKEEVKKLIDVAAIYKLNRFHWHLTDDQGWRIEIPEYPRLTEVGAIRSRSLSLNDPTNGTEYYDDTEYGRGCFYTLNDLREIVAYAKERCIEIIPEVDMPGHMVAAVASYPELSCDPTKQYEVRVAKGVSTDVLNIGDDKVIDFLKCVLGHVAEVFPFHQIHLGGDECPTTVWQNNADCARRIQEEGLSGVNELQPWLVETLGTWLKNNYGKEVIAWNELQNHWKSSYQTPLIIMSWTSTPGEAAAKGFRSIAVPNMPLYFDLLQISPSGMRTDEPYLGGYGDGAVNSVDRVYAYNPAGSLSTSQKDYCLGVQANLWTESCTSLAEAEYQLYPRMLALAEMAWLPADKKNFVDFYQRLQQHDELLDVKGIRYARHFIEEPDRTPAEAALLSAHSLLEATHPGAVGYPSEEACQALRTATRALEANPEDAELLAALQQALADFKAAPLVQPQAGRLYRILSASTCTRERYAGSSIYQKGDALYMHYTPQVEPEELWQFEPQGTGAYLLCHAFSGQVVTLPAYNEPVKLAATGGTPLVLASPTTAVPEYDYIPGVVMISQNTQATSIVNRLHGTMSGQVYAKDDSRLCYPGNWRIEEVTDFAFYLQRLCEKCERIIATAVPGQANQPSQQALAFLNDEILTPAREALKGDVTQETYTAYAALYEEYLQMPRATFADCLDTSIYYYISNAYYTDTYAAASTAGTIVNATRSFSATDDRFRWYFTKNDDGTVEIRNKKNQKAVYISSDAVDQQLKLGKTYGWNLMEITSDLGGKGISIVTRSGNHSWYTNPDAWNYVLLKPYDWGASIWTLTPIREDIVGIHNATNDQRPTRYYDMGGREVKHPTRGVYVTDQHRKVMK